MQLFDGYALLVGAGKLAPQLPPIPTANINADMLHRGLTAMSGYRSENTTRLTGPAVTRAQILQQVSRSLPVTIKPSTLFLFYFSGCGCLEKGTGRYFFLTADTDPRNLARTALSAEDLAAALDKLPTSRRLVILDCNPLNPDQAKQGEQGVGQAYALVQPPREILQIFSQSGEQAVVSAAQDQQRSMVDRYSGSSLFIDQILNIFDGIVVGIEPGELQLQLLAEYLLRAVPQQALRLFGYKQQPAALLTGHSFPVALIFSAAKGIEPARRETAGREAHHGQHAKPPEHGGRPTDQPKTAAEQAPAEKSPWEESFSFGIDAGPEMGSGTGGEPGPVMRGEPSGAGGTSPLGGGAGDTGAPGTGALGGDGTESSPPSTAINTGGGAVINGSVGTGGGDFIGRDQINNNVSAKYVILLNNDQGMQIGDNKGLFNEPDQIIGQLSLRLAVAVPKRVYLHEAFQIAAAIRLPKSPELKVDGLPSVTVDEFTALQTEKEYIRLRLQLRESASYRIIGQDFCDIVYLPNTNSALYYFELEALQTGKIYIIMEITQELGSVGSTRVVTTAAARKKPIGRVVAGVESQSDEPLPLEDVVGALSQLVEVIKNVETRDQAAVALRSLAVEARLGDQANAGRVQLWLGVLENCAPAVWKATLAAFSRPVIGGSKVIRKIAEAEAAQTQ